MKLIDANVLLNAVNRRSLDQAVAHRWLDDALSGAEAVAFSWIVLVAFVRISTHPRIFDTPLPVDEALEHVEAWLGAEPATIVAPTPRHFTIWSGLLKQIGTAGNLTNDAHIVALALEHGAEVVTFNRDFARFGVRHLIPS